MCGDWIDNIKCRKHTGARGRGGAGPGGARDDRKKHKKTRQPFACVISFFLSFILSISYRRRHGALPHVLFLPRLLSPLSTAVFVVPPTLQVKMSAADSARARAFFCLYAALDFFTPVIVAALIFLALAPFAADGVLEGAPLSETTRVFTSAAWRVVGLCFVGMVSMAVTESCE